MDVSIRGITCSLYNGAISEFLVFLSQRFRFFYIPWSSRISSRDMLLPVSSEDGYISSHYLREIASHCIWELCLQIYHKDADVYRIKKYSDYLKSPCFCYLVFYDCGLLDLYVKDENLIFELKNQLISLGATDLELLTDLSDFREEMY